MKRSKRNEKLYFKDLLNRNMQIMQNYDLKTKSKNDQRNIHKRNKNGPSQDETSDDDDDVQCILGLKAQETRRRR